MGVTSPGYHRIYRSQWIRTSSRMVCVVALGLVGLTLGGCSNEPIATWHMIDVTNVTTGEEQGDAHLITIGDTVVMIDAGYYEQAEQAVLPYLKEIGIKEIDHFFISHPHKDHYEGLLALLKNGFKVRNVYFRTPPRHICDREIPWGCDMESIERLVSIVWGHGISIHQPSTGFTLELPGHSRVEILHAQVDDLPTRTIDVNDLSLIMKWFINKKTVLFTGDLNMKVGSVLSKDPRMQADLMKMPHHGVTSLAPDSFFDRVDPDYVLVSGPASTWCGDSGARPRRWVARKGIPVWISGNSGHVRVMFYKNHTVISPQFNALEEVSAYERYVREHSDLAMLYQATNGGKSIEEWGKWHWETYGQREEGRELLEVSSYERYVREHPDVLANYRTEGSGKTMEEWGKWHWETYGQYEEGRESLEVSPYGYYVRKHADLLTMFRATNGGKTMEEWGRWHWEAYGQHDGRMSPEQLECRNKASGPIEWKD